MKKYFVNIVFQLCCLNIYAQVNLVPNWSFEDTLACPTAGSQLFNAIGWLNPTSGSPDYLNSCNPGIVNVPNSIAGFQYAKSGNAYAGIFTYSNGNNLREYIEIKLTDSLIANKRYCISFYVNLANEYGSAINSFGAYLSNSYVNSLSNINLPYVPQVHLNPNTFISDTLNWKQIEGSYIAHGGEQYITIGNFNDDAHTDTMMLFNSGTTYHYIDDVSIILCEAPIIPNVITANSDNQNDVFFITHLNEKSQLQIFNRWGAEIFKTTNYQNDWDAKNVSAGTYYYLLTTSGNEIYKGFIEVIK